MNNSCAAPKLIPLVYLLQFWFQGRAAAAHGSKVWSLIVVSKSAAATQAPVTNTRTTQLSLRADADAPAGPPPTHARKWPPGQALALSNVFARPPRGSPRRPRPARAGAPPSSWITVRFSCEQSTPLPLLQHPWRICRHTHVRKAERGHCRGDRSQLRVEGAGNDKTTLCMSFGKPEALRPGPSKELHGWPAMLLTPSPGGVARQVANFCKQNKCKSVFLHRASNRQNRHHMFLLRPRSVLSCSVPASTSRTNGRNIHTVDPLLLVCGSTFAGTDSSISHACGSCAKNEIPWTEAAHGRGQDGNRLCWHGCSRASSHNESQTPIRCFPSARAEAAQATEQSQLVMPAAERQVVAQKQVTRTPPKGCSRRAPENYPWQSQRAPKLLYISIAQGAEIRSEFRPMRAICLRGFAKSPNNGRCWPAHWPSRPLANLGPNRQLLGQHRPSWSSLSISWTKLPLSGQNKLDDGRYLPKLAQHAQG